MSRPPPHHCCQDVDVCPLQMLPPLTCSLPHEYYPPPDFLPPSLNSYPGRRQRSTLSFVAKSLVVQFNQMLFSRLRVTSSTAILRVLQDVSGCESRKTEGLLCWLQTRNFSSHKGRSSHTSRDIVSFRKSQSQRGRGKSFPNSTWGQTWRLDINVHLSFTSTGTV